MANVSVIDKRTWQYKRTKLYEWQDSAVKTDVKTLHRLTTTKMLILASWIHQLHSSINTMTLTRPNATARHSQSISGDPTRNLRRPDMLRSNAELHLEQWSSYRQVRP